MAIKKASPDKKTAVKAPITTKTTTAVINKKKLIEISSELLFDRRNFILIFGGIALILLGFILMMGGDSKDPNVWNEEIFNFRRLTLAPILVVAGYVMEIFAIMLKPKTQE